MLTNVLPSLVGDEIGMGVGRGMPRPMKPLKGVGIGKDAFMYGLVGDGKGSLIVDGDKGDLGCNTDNSLGNGNTMGSGVMGRGLEVTTTPLSLSLVIMASVEDGEVMMEDRGTGVVMMPCDAKVEPCGFGELESFSSP